MSLRYLRLALLIFIFALASRGYAQVDPNTKNDKKPNPNELVKQANLNNGKFFIENKGQWDEQVLAYVKGVGYNVWITKDGLVYDLQRIKEDTKDKKREEQIIEGDVHKIKFDNKNKNSRFTTNNKLATHYNYFIGDSSKWRANVGLYKDVLINEVYNGIDMKYYLEDNNLKYDFIVKKNSDPKQIKFEILGNVQSGITPDNELEIETYLGKVKHQKLFAYQNINGQKKQIECRLEKKNGKIEFFCGDYNKNEDLIIDPTVVFSTYYGSDTITTTAPQFHQSTSIMDITYDKNENLIFCGNTFGRNFPLTLGAYSTSAVLGNATYFSKLTKDGQNLLYSTFFNTADNKDYAALTNVNTFTNNKGEDLIYLSGTVNVLSSSSNLFTWTNPYIDLPPIGGVPQISTVLGSPKAILLIFDTKGTGTSDLKYSTFWGRTSAPVVFDMDISYDGKVSIVGGYNSGGSLIFTETNDAYQSSVGTNGNANGFLTIIDPKGNSNNDLIYSTSLNGTATNSANYEVVYGVRNYHDYGYNKDYVYLVGNTATLDFPITVGTALLTTNTAEQAGFLTVLDYKNTSNQLYYSTFIGDNGKVKVTDVDVDKNGNAHLTGGVYGNYSSITQTTNAYADPLAVAPSTYAFYYQINPKLSGTSSLIYGCKFPTYVSSYAQDYFNSGEEIIIDRCGRVVIAGIIDAQASLIVPGSTPTRTYFKTVNQISGADLWNSGNRTFMLYLNPKNNGVNDLEFSSIFSSQGNTPRFNRYQGNSWIGLAVSISNATIATHTNHHGYLEQNNIFNDILVPNIYNTQGVITSISLDCSSSTFATCCDNPNTTFEVTKVPYTPGAPPCCFEIKGSIDIANCAGITKVVLERYDNFEYTYAGTKNVINFTTNGNKKTFRFEDFCPEGKGESVTFRIKFYDAANNVVCFKEATASCDTCCEKVKQVKLVKISSTNSQCCYRIDGIVDVSGTNCIVSAEIFELVGSSYVSKESGITWASTGVNKGKFSSSVQLCANSPTGTYYKVSFKNVQDSVICEKILQAACVSCCDQLNEYLNSSAGQYAIYLGQNYNDPNCKILTMNIPNQYTNCFKALKIEHYDCENSYDPITGQPIISQGYVVKYINTNFTGTSSYQPMVFCCNECLSFPLAPVNRVRITFTDEFGNECVIIKDSFCTPYGKKSNGDSGDNNDGTSLDNQILDYSVQPNPSSDRTSLRFNLSDRADTKIEIFNSAGQSVMLLKSQIFAKGENLVDFDAKELQNGAYFIRISTTSGANVSIPLTIKR